MVERCPAGNYNSEPSLEATDASIVINGDTITMTAAHSLPMPLMSIPGTPSVEVSYFSGI